MWVSSGGAGLNFLIGIFGGPFNTFSEAALERFL